MKDSPLTPSLRPLALVPLLLLLLSGCVTDGTNTGSSATTSSNDKYIENPLKGVELDLAFSDVLATLLRTDELMLNRIPISGEDTWPSKLPIPGDKAYQAWLEECLADDFGFFIYYGDMNFAEMFSPEAIAQRIFIEGAQTIGAGLEHQLHVISYLPLGCDGPTPKDMEVPESSYCELVKINHKCSCGFFDTPLETQLKAPMLAGDIETWVRTPVESECLIKSRAATDTAYNSFNTAFLSLLPDYLLEDIQKAEEQISDVSEELKALYLKRSELQQTHKTKMQALKAQLKTLREKARQAKAAQAQATLEAQTQAAPEEAAQQAPTADAQQEAPTQEGEPAVQLTEAEINAAQVEENTQFDAALDARNKEIEAADETMDTAKEVYAKLMEEAMASPEGTPENIKLARNLAFVADSVDTNLDKAGYGAGTMLTKLTADIIFLSQKGLNPAQYIAAIYNEIKKSGKAKTDDEALKMATERVELDLQRMILLIPNTIYMYAEINRQSALLGPKIEYLEKLASLGEN